MKLIFFLSFLAALLLVTPDVVFQVYLLLSPYENLSLTLEESKLSRLC